METASLKSFATWARTALIREVTARIAMVLAPASPERVEQPRVVTALEEAVSAAGGGDDGRSVVADRVAYTWFNRIIALRFMDANGYTGIGVVSPQAGVDVGQPEVLAEAKRSNIDSEVVSQKVGETVAGLLNGTRRSDDPQGEAYALLLAEYCRHWNRFMPFMFERAGNFTELLIPANLLADDSVLNRAVKVLTTEVCQDVEVIGWLYQFYISERKDEVFAGFKKGKKAGPSEIPAATQLFTPDWIVRYLVENSLGRLWILNRPDSRLVDRMEYYIAPMGDETDFLGIDSPEDVKVIDPACGSGHMLTYAFDLLYAIYEEEGYAPTEIPGLILANNLYGTEIDPRAGALAAFALTMKARNRQRTFFSKQVEPNVCVLEAISFTPTEMNTLLTLDGDSEEETFYWNQFEHADMFGSLIETDTAVGIHLASHLGRIDAGADLLVADTVVRAERVLKQAEYLSPRYSVVVANPPYMGQKNMSPQIAEWLKARFPSWNADLFSAATRRYLNLVVGRGHIGLMSPFVWMFISTYKEMRKHLLFQETLTTLVQLEYSGFEGATVPICAFTAERGHRRTRSSFVRLADFVGPAKQAPTCRAIIQASSRILTVEDGDSASMARHLYRVDVDEFKSIPGSPIAYWLSDAMRAAFRQGTQLGSIADARKGLGPGDADRFVRMWWEPSASRICRNACDGDEAAKSGARWFPFNKGGDFRKWYGNQDFVVNWESRGKEIRNPVAVPGARPQNIRFYFLPTVSWSKVSSGAPAFRAFPSGWIFSDAGLGLYSEVTEPDLRSLLAICNSSVVLALLQAISPTLNFEAGQIATLPIQASLPEECPTIVDSLVANARDDWNDFETSSDFAGLAIVGDGSADPLSHRVAEYLAKWAMRSRLQQGLETRNNELVAEAYSVGGEVLTDVPLDRVSLTRNVSFTYGSGLSDEDYLERAMAGLAKELVSYAVGCMMGRYSLDVPGLILANHGESQTDFLARVPNPSFEPDSDNAIPIVDGDWFEDDIVARFRQFLRAAFGEEHFEENLRFVTESLGVKDLRDYFVKSFYKDHVQRYKKRPIYWLFSSPKGSFNALVYMHRYTPSTVSTVLNEYLREYKAKLGSSLQHHERLAAGGGGMPREQAAAQKEADRLRKVLLELDEYEHEVLYPLASQQIEIDLDDGVKVNYPKFGAALKKIPGLEVAE